MPLHGMFDSAGMYKALFLSVLRFTIIIVASIYEDDVLLDKHFTGKLRDFGFTQELLSTRGHTMVTAVTIEKSLGYTPPEQDTCHVSPKSDVYSYGIASGVEHVGLDYCWSSYLKRSSVRRTTIVKCYISVFVSMSDKAVHLELVSDLTAEAFIPYLQRFTSRKAKQTSIWSDHSTCQSCSEGDVCLLALQED